MGIKFYHVDASMPCRAVFMTLKALNIDHEVYMVNAFENEHKKDWYLKINPRGKVPALEDDGLCMGESYAIQAYLCNKYPEKSAELYPTDPVKRAKVDQMLHITYVMEEAVRKYPDPMNIFTATQPDESLRPPLEDAMKLLNGFLENSAFVAGDNPTIADFGLYGWTVFPNIVPGGFNYTPFPNVSRWIKSMEKLPYHDECNKTATEFWTGLASKLKPYGQ